MVSFISSLGVFGISTIERRMGADRVTLQIPDSLKRYTSDHYMGGVDNIDKDKCIGGSFTGRAMFKKWYCMGLMGIFDFMVVNGQQTWKMSTKLHDDRYIQTNSHFHIGLAEEMLRFRDESAVNFASEARWNQAALMVHSGHGMAVAHRPGRIGCCVCQLEKQFQVAKSKSNVQFHTKK